MSIGLDIENKLRKRLLQYIWKSRMKVICIQAELMLNLTLKWS